MGVDRNNDEAQARLEAWLVAHPYGDQDENGIDLSLLRANRKLTPLQRLMKLEHLLRTLPRGDKRAT
jgi:hypothetical protein